MKYATWKLHFENPHYGTGPETLILEKGGKAIGAFVQGQVENDGLILGYIEGSFDNLGLEKWFYQEIDSALALDFVLSINPNVYINNEGYIVTDEINNG